MNRSITALAALGLAGAGAAAADDETENGPITFEAAYTLDVMGVADGGLAERGRFLDNFDAVADFDLARLSGWRGAAAHVHLLYNGGGEPNLYAGTLQGIDNIEVSSHRLRLFEAWIEQSFGAGSARVGLYDVNAEFYANDAAGLLIAPAFGIGSEIAATGPNGPSIFPSTGLALRLATSWENGLYLRGAIVNAEAGVLGDPDGVDLTFDEGALTIVEAGREHGGGKLAAGYWRYTHRQDDIRERDAFGDPRRRVADGAYVLAERPLNDPEGLRATTAFFRAGVSDGDTTAFAGGWQAGFLIERVFAARPDSAFSFGINRGVLSNGHRQNEIDLGADMADAEMQFEITYSDALCPHLTIQPDLQFVRRPSGNRGIDDALVVGIRLTAVL